jgi:hypothetical protein
VEIVCWCSKKFETNIIYLSNTVGY